MTTQQAALENLRVIRSLMEKAHIYRAISAPAALVGGLLALAAAAWGIWEYFEKGRALCPACFLATWFIVLGITSILNLSLLARDARRRGHPFVSEGMRAALRALLPPLFVGGVAGTALILYMNSLTMAALIWVLCYGLALIGTASFSPRSLVRLGWLFISVGLVLFWVWAVNSDIRLPATDGGPASIVMGVTFGLLHIGYALSVFFSRTPEAMPAE